MSDIELVIKIPEDTYKKAVEFGHLDMCGIELANAVFNGTPLPKGHGRLIDENDLWFEDIDNISCVTQRNVEHAPTIIEADKAVEEDDDE